MLKRKIIGAITVGFMAVTMVVGSFSVYAAPYTGTIPGTERTEQSFDASFLSVTGFAKGKVYDRTAYLNTDAHRVVNNEEEFLQAIDDAKAGKVKIIEITNDLDMGYSHLSEKAKQSQAISDYRNNLSVALTNPAIMASGISQLTVNNTNGLTIFSRSGVTIHRAEFKLQGTSSDIVIRNINFEGMWHFSESNSTKECGWSSMKVNGAKGVWFDHCSFANACDGNADSENGASGLTYSWCVFGVPTIENPPQDGAIFQTVTYMEYLRQSGKLDNSGRFSALRANGATLPQIMAYEAYHCKLMLIGSGDKDYKDDEVNNLQDGNQRLELTLAYDLMLNEGQRLPRMRQGKAHMFNCFADNTGHFTMQNSYPFSSYGRWTFGNGIDVHFGGSVGVDTCVFDGLKNLIMGYEKAPDDTSGLSEWDIKFGKAYNYTLIVNSKVTELGGATYTGSSWDNNGDNLFAKNYEWYDKSTIGKWCWSTSIKDVDTMQKALAPAGQFDILYDYDYKLPYTYKTISLDKVEDTVSELSGPYKYSESPEFWVRTEYDASENYVPVTEDKMPAVTSIALNAETKKIGFGDTYQLIAEVIPSDAGDKYITFTSSNPMVAEVLNSGLVIGRSNGKATITATTSNGVSSSCDIEIYYKGESIKLNSKSKTMIVGEPYQLTAVVSPIDATYPQVEWSSNNEAVASVDSTGLVTPLSNGNAVITCKLVDDESIQTTCKISVRETGSTETPGPTESPEVTETPKPTNSAEPAGIIGDVDFDGNITAKDALAILKHAAKIEIFKDEIIKIADMNQDGIIDAKDALSALKTAAKL